MTHNHYSNTKTFNSTEQKQHQIILNYTHCYGHILDWKAVRKHYWSVSQCKVQSTSFSDHDAIIDLTVLNNSLTHCRVLSSRDLRKTNPAKMQADIKHLLDTELADCTNTKLADLHSEGLHSLLEQHIPLDSKKVTKRTSAPWRTDSIRTAKRELQQAERKWRSSGLTVHKELYSTKLNAYTASIHKAKRQYYNDVICNCPSSKQLYNVTNQLLSRTKKTSLPNNIPTNDLPDTFWQFFNHKVEQIRYDRYSISRSTRFWTVYWFNVLWLWICDRSDHASADVENGPKKL